MPDGTVAWPLVTSLVLTPVVMTIWRRFTILMIVGLFIPLLLLLASPSKSLSRLLGFLALQFGLMIDLPVAVIAAMTMRQGIKRFQEFWRYYEIKYGIAIRGIAWIYIPIGLLGPIGLVMVLWRT